MTDNKDYELRSGAVYELTYGTNDEVLVGTFCGYTMIGSETALVLKSEEQLVYILTSSLICMKLVEQVPVKEPVSSKDIYYG